MQTGETLDFSSTERAGPRMFEALQQLGDPDKGVLIGIVDGLPDLECAPLQNAGVSVEQSMVPESPGAPNAHGTEICSLIFGRPPKALGLARGCSGLSLPIFFSDHDHGSPRPASQMDLARALTIAVERGVSIVNVSAGQKASTPEAGRHLEDALSLCDRHRVLVIAAAGNDGCACLHVPAASLSNGSSKSANHRRRARRLDCQRERRAKGVDA